MPTLKSPLKGSLTSSLTPTLEWQPSAEDASYGLQVAADQGFSNLIIDEKGLKEASYVVPSPKLDYGKTYYWRVGVGTAGGKSGWSPFWSFEVLSKPTPPPAPTFPPTTKTIPPATVVGFYGGPLFDTHLHMGNIQNAQLFPNYLQQRKVDWALGFYVFSSDASSTFVRSLTTNGAKSGVIPLLQLRDPKSVGWSQFISGQFSEEVLRKFLRPQGTLQGAGEIVLYEADLQNVTLDSPVMQTVFKVVNEMKGIVMVHPSNVERGGRPTELSEIEPSVRKYPNAIFLFHGKSVSNLVIQLMDKYPNVYFTMDVLNWIFITKNLVNYNLLNPEGAAAETAERFLADVSRIGSDRLVEDGLTEALPLLQKYPDRIFWGTDFSKPYHFEDAVTDKVIEITRKFIGKLPADIQEKYAYQNAQTVFGRFLTP